MEVLIRNGKAEDVGGILKLIKELAVYEKAGDQVSNTEDQMLKDGFGDKPIFQVIVAEDPGSSQIIGISLFYTAYSTWKGRMIYLDDIVVSLEYRKKGIGKKLLEATIKYAVEQNARIVKWQVLDWNEPAIRFYEKYPVKFDKEWINCTINDDHLANFAL